MANILYLVHRLPYPPNKGDKVRSHHLLKHLSQYHQVFLGTFVDDADDEQYVPTVRSYCQELHVVRMRPRMAKVGSLLGLLDGRPLSLAYYANGSMRRWVAHTAATQRLDAVVVFSSAMGQYVENGIVPPSVPVLVDFVDVDSAKWSQYAAQHRWPMSWVYAREGDRLLIYEQKLATLARKSFFVTDNESAMFRRLAPSCGDNVQTVSNGVDAQFFSPDPDRESPFAATEVPVVFTGAMDYWPNIDAVTWFVGEMLPQLRKQVPGLRFYIVGRSPSDAVQALASDAVVVTGTVADVRPFLQFAAVVVAPMRVARGVQNKVLEAMAMGRPVVCARDCAVAISATDGKDLLAAETAAEYVDACQKLLAESDTANAIGQAGRACVVGRFSWDAHLSQVDHYLTASALGGGEQLQRRAHVAV